MLKKIKRNMILLYVYQLRSGYTLTLEILGLKLCFWRLMINLNMGDTSFLKDIHGNHIRRVRRWINGQSSILMRLR